MGESLKEKFVLERESKTIITREWVENELRFYNTADIKYLTLNLFTMGLALGVPPLYLITRQRAFPAA